MSERAVDGAVPKRVERPDTPEALASVIRGAHERHEAVVLWGGGTRIGVGDAPSRYDVAVEMRGLAGVIEHSPSDLVCTALAGTTLAELDRVLRATGQRWPVEAPCPEQATVGGTIAGAAVGPSRLRYAHPRDWIIGCRAVLGDGTLTRAGGRVVKNVTGYDLTRLYSGSYGTLVALAEITLKLVALPDRSVTMRAATGDAAAALATAAELRATRLPLDALAVVSGDAARRLGLSGAIVFARIAGVTGAVERVLAAARGRGLEETDGAVWDRITSLSAGADHVVRASWPAGRRPPADLGLSHAVIYPGSGVAFVLSRETPADFIATRARIEAASGALVLERADTEYKRAVGGAWGRCAVPHGIARELKRRFDPHDVLAPGRMPLAS